MLRIPSPFRAAALAVLTLAFPLSAQAPGLRRAQAVPAEGAIAIDGRLEEGAWRSAPVLQEFVQRDPEEGAPASERTEVRILYDDQALYIGAWLFDSEPSRIVLGETRRDAEVGDVDALLILLDTYRDRQNGYVFGTTPAGIEYDGQVTREGEGGAGGGGGGGAGGAGGGGGGQRQQRGSGGGFNKNWDGSWEVATTQDDQGWYAEFRIPFSTLRYDRAGAQEWGLNVSRTIRRRNEDTYWAPIPRQYDLNRVSLAGDLRLEAPVRRTAQVTPYLLGSARRDYTVDPFGAPETEWNQEVGADARIGLTPSLALDLTANTDFAQVEVDDEQVNLTRFRLFFPEKRPFFLENAGTFSVGTPRDVELFFSRRIGIEDGTPVPILAGGRLTGKVAGMTVGVLDIQTDRVLAGGGVGVVDTLASPNNFGALRVMRELPNRSRVGTLLTSRVNTDDVDDHGYTLAIDGRLGIGESNDIDAYAARTSSPASSGGEHVLSATAQHNSRDWQARLGFREQGAGFDPGVGFLSRPEGHRFYTAYAQRRVRFDGISWFRELRPHASYRAFTDLDGFLETGVVHIDSHFEFADGSFFQLPAINIITEGLKEPFEVHPGVTVPAGTYTNFDWGFAYNTNLAAPVSLEGTINLGGLYTGTRRGTTGTLTMRQGDAFVASLRFSHDDVDLPQGDFTATVFGLRAAWAFTPRIYLQSLLQYNSVTEAFSGNVRFGWLNTAGTGLFLVYNDLQHTGRFEDTGIPRGPLDRTLVVKFTRRFDFEL